MRSKLSLHIMNWDPVEKTNQFIERVQPPLIKLLDGGMNDSKVEEVKRNLAPGTLVVGRVFFDDQHAPNDQNLTTYNPVASAQAIFGKMQESISKMDWRVDVWEGINEIAVDSDKEPLQENHRRRARLLSAFNVELAKLMHGAGKKYAAYSFSTGNPNHLEIWDELLPGLLESDYLALHEYIYPTDDYQTPDMSMCNRYRKVYERLPAAARKKILITECGADLHGVPGAEGGGFKNKLVEPKYWQWLAAYDAELMKDPYVVGATIYTYGSNPDWVTYDISGSFTKLMMNEIMQLPDQPIAIEAPPPPVVVTPPPPPIAGLLLLAQVRSHVQDAIAKLEASDGNGARDILVNIVSPWFYGSAPQHSTDLDAAKAHTTARWFSEEATRKIEANQLNEARDALRNQVLAWMDSELPKKIGILAAEEPEAKMVKVRKARAKKARVGVLSAETKSKAKRARAKKKTGTKGKKK